LESIEDFLASRSEGGLVPLAVQLEAKNRFQLTLREAEEFILSMNLLPVRYARNRKTFSTGQQLALLNSRVAVIGCGGLGGYIVEELARLGVGSILVVDPDVFDEQNLNRQLYALPESLGLSKSVAAVRRAREINPAVDAIAMIASFTEDNGEDLLMDAHVAADALDNVPDRLMLQEAARRLGVPMIHGALAGFEGRIMTVYPGDPGLKQLYNIAEKDRADQTRPEALLGVPAVTAAVIGTFQAMEVLKVLLHRGKIFRHIMAHIDLENGRFEKLRFDEPSGGNDDPCSG